MSVSEPGQPLSHRPQTPDSYAPEEPNRDALSGPLGLRAGWGIALYLVLALLLFVVLFAALFKGSGQLGAYQREGEQARAAAEQARAMHRPVPQPAQRPGYILLMEAAELGAVLLAAWALSKLEKRRFRVYGLRPQLLPDLVPGALWGLFFLSLLVALLHALRLVVFDRELLTRAAAWKYGAVWLLIFLLVGLFEEFFFRGYLQFTLMRGLLKLHDVSPERARKRAFWTAAVLLSLFFSLVHLTNAGEDPVGIAVVFVAGMLFSYALWRTGSLWWGVGFHMTWDWCQSFLFGVPDSGTLSAGRLFATHATGNPLLSGGAAGPEGSIYVLPVLLLAALAIRLQPQRDQPPVEPASLPLALGSAAPEAIP